MHGTLDEISGHWRDSWSPQALLRDSRLDCVIGADVVRAIGPAVDGDAGDITIAIDRTEARKHGPARVEDLHAVLQGESALLGLRKCLKAEFERPGSSHWGMETDVKHLIQALNVGTLNFAEQLQADGTKCLVNLNLPGRDLEHEYYVCL